MIDISYLSELEAKVLRLEQENINLKSRLLNMSYDAEKFSKAFYNNQAIMIIFRRIDGVCIEVNDSFSDILGYRREEVIGESIYALGIWHDQEERQDMYNELFINDHIRNFELRYQKKSGDIGVAFSSINILHINNEECLLVSAIDITESKRLEELLLLSEEKYFKAFHNNQAMISITRLKDGACLDINNACEEITGYKREELIGKTGLYEYPCAERAIKQDLISQVLTEGHIRNFEHKYKKKCGEIGYSLSSHSLIDLNGEKYLLNAVTDITERKQAEKSLSQSNLLLQQIVNSIPLPMMIISARDRTIVEANDIYLTSHNLTKKNVIGYKHKHAGNWQEPYELDQFIETIKQQGSLMNYEMKYSLSPDDIRTIIMSGVSICWQGEDCILVVYNDITELRKYQNEIYRLDNLNLIGQMAASIAHEIRNPMTSMKGFLQLFKSKGNYIEDEEAIDLLLEELDRINNIITDFLSLAQKNEIKTKLVNLNDNIKNLLPLLTADAMKNDIIIKTELQNVSLIKIDEGEMRQLMLNLVRNGIEAMSGGRILTIKTYEDIYGVNLVIMDQGDGIPLEILGKIGKPFFTTKANGTGLGLAVCYSIAERHNARIEVNTSAEGTVFTIIFPAVR